MEKRLFLAAILSIIVLLLWEALTPKAPPPARPASPAAPPSSSASTPTALPPASAGTAVVTPAPPPSAEPIAPVSDSSERRVVVDRPLYRATFSNKGGVLTSFVLKKYDDDQGNPLEMVHHAAPGDPPPLSLDFGSDKAATEAANGGLYQVDRTAGADSETVVFRFASEQRGYVKKFRFGPGYLVAAEISSSGSAQPFFLALGPGLRNPTEKEKENRLTGGSGAVLFDGEDARSISRDKVAKAEIRQSLPKGGYVGLEDNYFLAVMLPSGPSAARLEAVGKGKDAEIRAGVEGASHVEAKLYLGPKDLEVLNALNLHLQDTVRFRAMGLNLGLIAKPLIWLLRSSYRYLIPNWGVAILVTTFVVRLLLFPLMHKSVVGMKKMQKLQPKMNAIKEKYKKSRTDAEQRNKMNQELMALYQSEGYNPMSGCLPILLQMPILLAFYAILERMIELRHAPFYFWIHDLSAKDPTYVLVILMTVTMFIQQWMTPSTVDPAQKRLFMMMPLMWGFFLKEMPSGLVLYWLFSNVLTIGQQALINRMTSETPTPPPAGAKVKKARAGG
jgi:YidC/Oxa1 family membrane protein insertase